MLRTIKRIAFGVVLGVLALPAAPAALAQDSDAQPLGAAAAQSSQQPNVKAPVPGAAVGPIVYLVDDGGRLGALDLGTGIIRIVGSMGVRMIDIGFDPSGKLFGLNGNSFYRIDVNTARATFIGNHNLGSGSGLICGKSSKCFATANFSTNLFEINARTGAARVIGTIGFTSAGDLAFFKNDTFVFSTSSRQLVTLNRRTGQALKVVNVGISGLFGLVSINNVIFGFAGTTAYRLDPNTGRSTVVANFGGQGFAAVLGASYSIKVQR